MDMWINMLIGGVVVAISVGFLYALASRLETTATGSA